MEQSITENRLRPEEIAYRREGDSLEIAEWNREFAALIAEYEEALTCQDEGWIGDLVHEVRKCLWGLEQAKCHLAEAAKQVLRQCPERRQMRCRR